MTNACIVAGRIEQGIELLATDPLALDAFRIANRTMARGGPPPPRDPAQGPGDVDPPEWRPFQLAFILMNLRGHRRARASRPRDRRPPLLPDRRRQDRGLPRPGGVHPGPAAAAPPGRVLGRRLRAHALHAAAADARPARPRGDADLRPGAGAAAGPRQAGPVAVRDRPVGRARRRRRTGWATRATTTRNRRGRRRSRFQNDDRKPSPIPLENCPWCGTKFSRNSFQLCAEPERADRTCGSPASTATATSRGDRPLPILAVDEPIYRRLPCFLIATVDKFAAHAVDRGRWARFFGRCERARRRTVSTARATAGQAAALAGAAAAARSDHPGRAAPDLRSAGHDGRPLRDGPRRALLARRSTASTSPAEDRRLDGDGPARRQPDPRAVRPARRSRSSRRPAPIGAIRSSPRHRPRPRRAPRGSTSASPPRGAARRWSSCGPTWRCWRPRRRLYAGRRADARTPDNPADPYMTLRRLLQQPARAGRQPPDRRGRGRHPARRATASAGGWARRRASSPTARSPTRWSS